MRTLCAVLGILALWGGPAFGAEAMEVSTPFIAEFRRGRDLEGFCLSGLLSKPQ